MKSLWGMMLQAGLGQNPARQDAVKAGLPQTVPALPIKKVCVAGLKTVHLARQAIIAGDADILVAGGMENRSQSPYLLKIGREGFKMGDHIMIDSMIPDGLWCAFSE